MESFCDRSNFQERRQTIVQQIRRNKLLDISIKIFESIILRRFQSLCDLYLRDNKLDFVLIEVALIKFSHYEQSSARDWSSDSPRISSLLISKLHLIPSIVELSGKSLNTMAIMMKALYENTKSTVQVKY